MALDVATLPLILYRKVYTHALSMYYIHCENIIHIPTLFYYFAIPTLFFSFPMFFLLVYSGVMNNGITIRSVTVQFGQTPSVAPRNRWPSM